MSLFQCMTILLKLSYLFPVCLPESLYHSVFPLKCQWECPSPSQHWAFSVDIDISLLIFFKYNLFLFVLVCLPVMVEHVSFYCSYIFLITCVLCSFSFGTFLFSVFYFISYIEIPPEFIWKLFHSLNSCVCFIYLYIYTHIYFRSLTGLSIFVPLVSVFILMPIPF